MSALGHEQTSRHVRVMSALPPKALTVRLVPKAVIVRSLNPTQSGNRTNNRPTQTSLVDNLISTLNQNHFCASSEPNLKSRADLDARVKLPRSSLDEAEVLVQLAICGAVGAVVLRANTGSEYGMELSAERAVEFLGSLEAALSVNAAPGRALIVQ